MIEIPEHRLCIICAKHESMWRLGVSACVVCAGIVSIQ